MMYQKARSSNPALPITSQASQCSRRERFLNELSGVQIGKITRDLTAASVNVSTFHFASRVSQLVPGNLLSFLGRDVEIRLPGELLFQFYWGELIGRSLGIKDNV